MTNVFITGAAGFIGANLAKRVLTDEPGAHVVGLDNLNDYYDVRLKQARLAELEAFEHQQRQDGGAAGWAGALVCTCPASSPA